MQRIIKFVKGALMILAVLAVMASFGPLSAQTEEHKDDGSGGSGTLWHVTCQYDGNDVLLSKTCTSGGSHSCAC